MRREKAYVDGRREKVLELIRETPEIKVAELADLLQVSMITIRRDLQYLENKNQLVRFYGGASIVEENKTGEDEIEQYKKMIARYAASLVEAGDSLFINTSSTALHILEYINQPNVTVITNNGKAIYTNHSDSINVILTGGELRYPKNAMVGDFALRNLQTVFPKKAFVGCAGISLLSGMSTEIIGEVKINELMIQNATQEVYVLADHTKIGKNSSFTSAPIDKITHLITDEKASEDVLMEFKNNGVKIYQVSKNGDDRFF